MEAKICTTDYFYHNCVGLAFMKTKSVFYNVYCLIIKFFFFFKVLFFTWYVDFKTMRYFKYGKNNLILKRSKNFKL